MEISTREAEELVYRALSRAIRAISTVIGLPLGPEGIKVSLLGGLDITRDTGEIGFDLRSEFLIIRIPSTRIFLNSESNSIKLKERKYQKDYPLPLGLFAREKLFLVVLRDSTPIILHLSPFTEEPLEKVSRFYFWTLDLSLGDPIVTRGILETKETISVTKEERESLLLPEFYEVLIVKRREVLDTIMRIISTKEIARTSESEISISRVPEVLFLGKLIADIRRAILPIVSSEFQIPLRDYNIDISCMILLRPLLDPRHPIKIFRENLVSIHFLAYNYTLDNLREHGLIPLLKGPPQAEIMIVEPLEEIRSESIEGGMVLLSRNHSQHPSLDFFGIYRGWIFLASIFRGENGVVRSYISLFYDRRVYPFLMKALSTGLFIRSV